MRRAIVCVTNDLRTDNRVHRTCTVLQELGWEVLLVGRRLPGSAPLQRSYATRRLKLPFRRGALFYAVYNVRLFFLLLFTRCALIVANDLDTLPAAWLAARCLRRQLVYDSHEFFTEVPELFHADSRPRFARRVWRALERIIFPGLRHVITVNESIASAYRARYGNTITVVRNIPMPQPLGALPPRAELQLPTDRFVLVMQGSGINVQRGAEEAVLAMRELPDVLLLLIGGGDAWPVLQQLVADHALEDRVRMLPRMPYARMMGYTRHAQLGLSLDKDTNLNYRYSLPNKLFDYFHAGIPVLVTDLPEVAALVRRYEAGVVIPATAEPHAIVAAVRALQADPVRMRTLREKAIFAAASLDGASEMRTLRAFFQALG